MKLEHFQKQSINHIDECLMSVSQTAEFLNLKVSRVRNMVFKKQIPYLKVGASIRFDKEQLQNWIKAKAVEVRV